MQNNVKGEAGEPRSREDIRPLLTDNEKFGTRYPPSNLLMLRQAWSLLSSSYGTTGMCYYSLLCLPTICRYRTLTDQLLQMRLVPALPLSNTRTLYRRFAHPAAQVLISHDPKLCMWWFIYKMLIAHPGRPDIGFRCHW